MIHVVHLPEQLDRLVRLQPHLTGVTWKLFPAVRPILDTYRRLADTAIRQDWNETDLVMQDDVRFAAMPVHPPGVDVWVYGQRQHLGHVCPHAFTATRRGWRKLQVVWQRQANPKSMCVDWSRIIDGVTEGVAIHGV